MINLRMYLVIYYNRDKIQNYIYYHAFINICNINIFTFCKVDNLCKNNPTGFFGWLIICLKLCIYIFLPYLPMWSDSMSLRPIISLLEAFWIPSPKPDINKTLKFQVKPIKVKKSRVKISSALLTLFSCMYAWVMGQQCRLLLKSVSLHNLKM